ncbi:hypothetical protein N7492_006892 [Penicillium capsulatum]|uniref:Uncharacterized protein n=1 Tax=Penicillium capsulatum TaxID=69766 RepID=A0A9W9I3V4_9EURO|nr:hypothetical protein N7492_006892 [Penicillium capsulatum]KAJ6116726.1 hypothetical protein N7512_006451 [Penicillium capsulatum]
MGDGEISNAKFIAANSTRTRSGSASTAHKRPLSGTLLSKLSFLRMNQTTPPDSNPLSMEQDGDSEDLGSTIPQGAREGSAGSKAMAAVIQQQRRTRRRRGSLRKTALLGTRLEMRDKSALSKSADAIRAETFRHQNDESRPPKNLLSSPDNEPLARGSFDDDAEVSQPSWFSASTAQTNTRPSVARRRQGLARHNIHGEETATDDEDLVSFPHNNSTNNASTGAGANTGSSIQTAPTNSLHRAAQSSGSDSYFPLSADTSYRPVHRKSSPLATHPVEMKSNADIAWDYSETESWGWIILIVTWLVFVVGIGSCFEVWSWAWDVGETPYAPPELEDDPTLPIVGYYPALIILTAVMSWVWVVVAWVGMKYFKHANISGDDS